MTEELIEKLAHVSGLRVIARTTAMHYKNSRETTREIGRALNVGMVLEASVRKVGNRVRITAQLIETSSEEHLWAARYDRDLDDIFAVQDELSDQITGAISAFVSSLGDAVSLVAPTGRQDTTDMEAYTEFLQGRELFRKKISEQTILQALDLFERAVSRDPGFAHARVGIADCCLWLGGEGALPYADANKRAREELDAALATNEALAEAHSSLAAMMLAVDDRLSCKREAYRAIELNPSMSDPYRWLAQLEASGETSMRRCDYSRLPTVSIRSTSMSLRSLDGPTSIPAAKWTPSPTGTGPNPLWRFARTNIGPSTTSESRITRGLNHVYERWSVCVPRTLGRLRFGASSQPDKVTRSRRGAASSPSTSSTTRAPSPSSSPASSTTPSVR